MRYIKVRITWQSVSKAILFIFVLYNNWFKEIWGNRPIVLYGSVIALTISVFIPNREENRWSIDFDSMTSFCKVLFVFGIYCFISGFIVCVNRTSFISSMITYFAFFVVLFDCCVISKREGSWDWLLRIMFFVALICYVYAIFRGYTKMNGGAKAISLGPNNNPHSLAHVMLIGVFGLVANQKKGQKVSLFNLFFVLLFSYIIVLSGSRKLLISIIILFLIWALSSLKIAKKEANRSTRDFFIVGILVAVAIIVWFFKNFYKDSDQFARFMRLFDDEEDYATETRIKMYQVAFDLWKNNPIFGVGFDQFKFYSWRGDYAHSVYAEVLSCTGVIGCFIIFAPILYTVHKVLASIRQSKEDIQYRLSICMAALLAELFLGIGQIWIYSVTHELFLLCILGIVENTIQEEEKEDKIGEYQKCKYLL